MLENGGGYQNVAPTTQGKAELITVDGDGQIRMAMGDRTQNESD